MELINAEIRPMVVTDLKFFNKVRSESFEYLHDKTNYTFGENIVWFNRLDFPYFIFLIGDVPIGYFRTSEVDLVNKTMYVGMDIAPEHRGKGYATKGYEVFIDKLKNEYGFLKLYLEVLASNKRAINIYNKLGFTITDVLPYSDTDKSIKMVLELWN